MRLLAYNNDGEFSPTQFFGDDIPDQYAILSHRWGPEEVTVADLTDGTGKGMAGYSKIRFCGEQARRDGLQYFWVDCAPFAKEIFETIDCYEIVKSIDSFRMSMALCRNGIICGPSSGEALHGLLAYLKKQQAAGRLGDLADPETGETSCVFICADLPYQYIDLYHAKLPQDEFPKIYNEVRFDSETLYGFMF